MVSGVVEGTEVLCSSPEPGPLRFVSGDVA